MKPLMHHIRVPAEQFAYLETDFEGSAEEAVELYRHITSLVKGGSGLPDKEYDAFAQRQVSGEANHMEDYEKMTDEQKKYVRIYKRALSRVQYKVLKEEKENKENYDRQTTETRDEQHPTA